MYLLLEMVQEIKSQFDMEIRIIEMILMLFVAILAINACGLCVLMHKWDEHKEKQEHSLEEFKKKVFEHVRGEVQAAHIENEILKKEFKKFRDG